MRRIAIALVLAMAPLVLAAASGQTAKPVRKPLAPPPAPLTKVVPDVKCPTPLGIGVTTKLSFCDVMTGRDPSAGVLIPIPPHKGPVTLTFDLHNRHMYSDEQMQANRAHARYTATVGVLTMDNTLIGRAVVQNEFRKATDLVDRIGGGSRPGRCEGRRSDRDRAHHHHHSGERGPGQHPRGKAHLRAYRRQRDLHVARPAGCDHQQRDDRIPACAAAATAAEALTGITKPRFHEATKITKTLEKLRAFVMNRNHRPVRKPVLNQRERAPSRRRRARGRPSRAGTPPRRSA